MPWNDGTGCYDLSFLNVEFFFFFYLLTYLLAVLGLCCCVGFYSSCGAQASLAAGHGPWSTGLTPVEHRLSCSVACGLFQEHESNPCLPHQQVDSLPLSHWMLSFKPDFSLSSFTLIKRLFSSSSPSVIRVVLSAYLRLLVFLPAILIPACDSSSLAFFTMYSAYKLHKQNDNIQPPCTRFPILNQSFPGLLGGRPKPQIHCSWVRVVGKPLNLGSSLKTSLSSFLTSLKLPDSWKHAQHTEHLG